MELSEDIKQAIIAASESLKTNGIGELVLPVRKRIWAALGSRTVVRSRAVMGVGVRRRTRLAFLAVEHVVPLWKRTFPANHGPQRMLATAERYSARQIGFSTAWKLKSRFWGELERTASTDVAVGFAACQVVTTALSDERFDPENLDSPPSDQSLDPYEWDATFYASVACGGSAPWEGESKSGQRREFWQWYLHKAVRLAWDSAS